ncbi:DUF397 domain-containing protein [Streptomyces acidiscabies]|uniref:DUF397 domain-containing protein n=1 Tax=Streptomyces acidiscabies TaxID=42234 RepID=A0ABU4MA05_9ACTN|nr:DUF397 domain-containing protein [Streptomyces acidiscabies]MDX3024920.1 DUF397 domain-containing protein [Streptomyces acidiscabies]
MRHGLPEHKWRKSSYSGAQQGDCLEVQRTEEGFVAARDSKAPQLGAFVFGSVGWASFVDDVKRRHFE